MNFEDFSGDMKDFVENILSHSELKHCLVSLKEFEGVLKEANYTKSEIEEFIFKILFMLFITHFNLKDTFGIKDKKPGDEE